MKFGEQGTLGSSAAPVTLRVFVDYPGTHGELPTINAAPGQVR